METLNVVIAEILLCLVVAWILGFLAAWILFRRVQNEYEQEIEELEETLSYASTSMKNQERELTKQTLKIQELEKSFDKNIEDKSKEGHGQKNTNSQDKEILKLIDDNAYSPQKK